MAYPSIKSISTLLECCNNIHPLKVNYSVIIYLRHKKKERRTTRTYVVCKWITKRKKVDHKIQKENLLVKRLETGRIMEAIDYLQDEYIQLQK